jgi:hypothetical protein
MGTRPATITQKELTGYAKAMREAGVEAWAVDVEHADGTRVRITAGAPVTPPRGGSLDRKLGITNG